MGRFLLLLLVVTMPAFARLGDTLDQAEARYGLEKTLPKYVRPTPLLEGARELVFEFQGWKIRSALLLATDGKEYVIREEYTKLISKGIPPTGMFVTDLERDAILAGESAGKEWRKKSFGKVEADPLQTMANQFTHLSGLSGQVWVRDDGAVATLDATSSMKMILELPQAAKREAELKKIKED